MRGVLRRPVDGLTRVALGGFLAILAVLMVGTVAGAWVRALRPGDRVDRPNPYVERIDWRATLAADGTLAVRARYHLLPAGVRYLQSGVAVTFELPEEAVRLRIDDRPAVVATPGRTGQVPQRRTFTIAYDVPGAARRVGERVVLDTLVMPSLGHVTATSYGYAEVRGTLRIDAGAPTREAEWRLPGARLVRGDEHGPVLAFAGAVSTYDAAGLVALLPGGAAPDAPEAPGAAGGSGARGGDARAALDEAAAARSEGRIPDGHPVPQGSGPLVAAAVLTVELAGLALWSAHRLRRAHRIRTAGVGPPATPVPQPPDDVDPDVVAMLTGTGAATVATREAVAADLLAMVDRGTVRLASLSGRRFQLRIPAGARGTTDAEQAILTALRPQGQAGVDTELLGPPLWGKGPHVWLARFERDVRARARRAGYLARALPTGVFVPAAMLVPVTALVGSGGDDRVTGVGVAALLAALAFSGVVALISPLALTSRGAEVRRRARGFAEAVGDTGTLHDLGAPAVLTRGPHFVCAVAVGAAPTAARDVGTGRVLAATPDTGAQPVPA